MEQLHKGAKWLFRVKVYITCLVLIIFVSIYGIALLSVLVGSVFTSFLIILGGWLGVMIVFGEIYSHLVYKNWKYEFNPRELKIEKGVIFKVYKSIPYGRVQNVEIHRGVLARMTGFSTLNIHTAGYHSSGRRGGQARAEGHIPAVSIEGAEKIREFLMKKVGSKQGI